MTRRGYVLAAAACVALSWVPLFIGVGLDVFPLAYWGVLSAYVGVGWLLPAVFLGFAAADWARAEGRPRARAIGVGVGFGVGAGLLVGLASSIVALGGGDEDAGKKPVATTSPAASDQSGRITLVSVGARRRRYAPVDLVMCNRGDESLCAVTYAGPACQLWTVENVNGVDKARPLGEPDEGAHGTYDEGRDSIGCFSDTG